MIRKYVGDDVEVSRTVFRSWMLPLRGVEIALIDCAHQLFTYPNEFLVTVGHRGSDKRGSTVLGDKFLQNFISRRDGLIESTETRQR